MGIIVAKTKAMIISRHPSPVWIMMEQRELKYVEYFKLMVCSVIRKYATGTCEIESRTAMAKAAFNKKKKNIPSKLDINLMKNLVKCCIGSGYFGVAET